MYVIKTVEELELTLSRVCAFHQFMGYRHMTIATSIEMLRKSKYNRAYGTEALSILARALS